MLLTREATRKRVWALALAGLIATPALARAQTVVRAVIVGESSRPWTDGVRVSRFADLTEESRIAVTTTLDVGDLFWATRPDVLIELECPARSHTVARFSGSFRVVVLQPRPDVACVLQLLAGGGDVISDGEPTEINAGGIVLGSKGTQYAVRLYRRTEGPVVDTVVYDDSLYVRAPSLDTVELPSSSGWTYNVATRQVSRGAISEQMIAQSANIATKFDLTRWTATGTGSVESQRKDAEQQLLALHLAVLRTPSNQTARTQLGKTQEKFGSLDAARYNLRRAAAIRPGVNSVSEAAKPASPPAQPGAAVTTRGAQQTATTTAAITRTVAEPATRALEMVRGGNPTQAIALLRPRVDASQATTRDFYVLAEAYAATKDPAAASSAAARALNAPDATKVLSASEIQTLRAIRSRR